MNKKAITILGAIFLLIVGTLGFLIYQKKAGNKPSTSNPPPPVAQNNPPPPDEFTPPPVDENPPPPDEFTPPPAPVGAVRLSEDTVITPILFYQGDGVAYVNSKGQLFQADIQNVDGRIELTNKRELNIPLKANINKIIWPSSGNNFIAQFGEGAQRRWSVYISDKSGYTDLPQEITAINWMPSGDNILYIWLDKDSKATLNVSSPDSTNYKTLTDLWETDNDIQISPDGRNVLFYSTQSQEAVNKIKLVTIDGKIFKTVVQDGYNVGVLWSPDSKKFLFGRKDPNSQKIQLWEGNLLSGEVKNLNVFASVDKAVWSADSQSVFAAVPKDGSTGDLTQDTIVKINIATDDKAEFDPGNGVDAREMFLSIDGNTLYFRNFQDNYLYYLSLLPSTDSTGGQSVEFN